MERRIRLLFPLFVRAATALTTASFSCQTGVSITTFPSCDDFLNTNEACAVRDNPSKRECLCNQKYLDALYG